MILGGLFLSFMFYMFFLQGREHERKVKEDQRRDTELDALKRKLDSIYKKFT